jgi:hypothetical protein
MEENVLESIPEEELLFDEEISVELDITKLTDELLEQFKARTCEKLLLAQEKSFANAEKSLNKILNDLQVESKRRLNE